MDYKKIVEEALMKLPGKRGIDIPEATFDKMHKHAVAATVGVWGRHPTPQHFQELFDQGLTEPHQIQAAFGAMPHPHADGMTVDEYRQWSEAYQLHKHHTT